MKNEVVPTAWHKKSEILIHTRLQPGDREVSRGWGKPFKRFPDLNPARFTWLKPGVNKNRPGPRNPLVIFVRATSRAKLWPTLVHCGFWHALLLILVAAVAATAQEQANAKVQQTPSPPPASQTSPTDRYRIGPGEVLDIRFFKHQELSRENVRVDDMGMIRMPLIESDIQAACKTESELAKDIQTRYLKYYRNPQVDVFVKEYHSREVAVIGAITEQGRYQMQRRIRLLELISFAKGPTEKAGQTINIVRGPRLELCETNAATSDDGGFISLRLNDTLRGDDHANPYIQPGDIVTVPEADQVYVVGNVYRPSALPMKDPISVSRAVAMAGGPLQDSKTDSVRIVRQKPGSSTKTEIKVNLGAIARKQAEDVALEPNDIVEVPTSAGKVFLRNLMGAVAPSVSQLPVRIIP